MKKKYSLKRADGSPATLSEGIWRCLSPKEELRLAEWLPAFERSRESKGVIPAAKAFADLPYGQSGSAFAGEWRLRRKGWEWLKGILPPKYSSGLALDLGSWNGWLTNRLSGMGFEVIAADLFTDPNDGLGAYRHYPNTWAPVQINPNDLSVFQERFDLIVFNHCLAFLSDPLASLQQAQALLAPGGWIVLLGLSIFPDSAPHEVRIRQEALNFKKKYGQELLFYPSKGVLAEKDLKDFRELGFRFERYPGLWKSRLKAALSQSAPRYYTGTYIAPATL